MTEFLRNPVVSGVGFLILLAGLIIFFIRDVRRVKRGINISFMGFSVSPGDPLYNSAAIYYLRPYIIVFGVLALIALLCLYGIFFHRG